jgi:diguanylate cyclase (GGDEF)-like protein
VTSIEHVTRPAPAPTDQPDVPATRRPEQRYRAAVALAVLSVLLFGLWLAAGAGSAGTRRLVSDLVFVAAPAVAAVSCWRAHRVRHGRHTAWAWLAAGCLTWAAASVVWTVYETVLVAPSPFPSLADVGYIGYALPIAIGIARFPRSAGNLWSRRRAYFDSAVVAGSLLLVSVVWVLGPVVHATTEPLARLDALAYPLADVVVASFVLVRCMVLPRARLRVWAPLCVGLLVLAVTDSSYVTQTFTGTFRSGGMTDLGWLVSFLLVALAALVPAAESELSVQDDIGDAPSLAQEVLPYAALALAAWAYVTTPSAIDHPGRYLWLTGPLALAVGVRQLLVVADHLTLARNLGAAVERRTSQLLHRDQWWKDLVANLSDVVIVVGVDGVVGYISPSAHTSLSHWQRLADATDLQAQVHPEDRRSTFDTIRPVLEGKGRNGFVECRVRRADGSWGWFEVTAVGQLEGRALQGAVLTLHDVSDSHQLTDRLTHQAYHDALTGLPNRALLMERLDAALAHDDGTGFALLLMDLDDFKVINDRHGHASGDAVLEVIGTRLVATVRASDTVARLGGDEFALLLAGTPASVRRTAERLIEQVVQPIEVGGRRFLVRASIGVVFPAPGDVETPHSLLSHADIALYEAKARDKGGIVVIDGPERDAAAKQVFLREQIAQPVLEEFSVVYQPIVDLGTGVVRGVEALLRWQHPELGAVSPADFIPMSEYGGSIQVLGWHVMTQACTQLGRWRADLPDHRLAVGINVSIRQLDEPRFAERVLALVAHHGIEPDQIVLELTEQALAVDFETAVTVVEDLRAGGVSVAVDDYGTGYSSLRYLHRFAADVVKIDRSFVAKLEGSAHTEKIVRSVVHMAEGLDLQSIAEGIETTAQLGLLRDLGCELGQGFLFSRPVPPDEITALLRDGRPMSV